MADRSARPSGTGDVTLQRNNSTASDSGRHSSITGKPRSSVQGGAPRSSVTGKRTHRNNSRRSTRNGMDGVALQVIDDDGTDRTPKPLMSLNPSVLRGAGGNHDNSDAASDAASEFFLDRMSEANFSKAGWMSGTTSGSGTPKSEAEEEYDQMSKQKAADGADGAAAMEEGEEQEVHEEGPAEPELLYEKDLERSVYINLQETPTVFMLVVPCVTVAIDSEDSRYVEDANKRYAALLTVKQAADKFVDIECQTLDLLKKSREVQSAVYQVADTACQAATWDIADTYVALDEANIEADEGAAGLGAAQSVGQMAGNVGRGGNYAVGGLDGRSSTGSRRETLTSTGAGGQRESMMSGQSTYAAVAGMVNTTNNLGDTTATAANLPEGVPLDGPGDAGGQGQSLESLAGLREALELMDAAVSQNTYLPRLLLYRGIQQLAHRVPETPPERTNKVLEAQSTKGTDKLRGYSRAVSRAGSALSRQASDLSLNAESVHSKAAGGGGAGGQGAPSVRDMTVAGSVASGTSPHPAGPASVAESMWPEDLLQDLADLGPDGVPRIEHLWDWSCPLTSGAKVSCMTWNKKHPDLLAVGYGNNSFQAGTDAAPQKGLVAFWSLKNPGYPLWSFATETGVTALDFAMHSPNILAVGMYDGTVAIYDVKSRQGSPSMESDASTGRHSDPVWKVKWIDRGHERDEPLVSISTDGRVTQWSIAKGLEFVDLMKLKRVPRRQMDGGAAAAAAAAPAAGSTGGTGAAAAGTTGKHAAPAAVEHDAFISRLTSGMSFDFSGRDERIYIAGTEDGWIHRCSTSYSEQYLESYQGHMGPIYNVQWSPFRRDMFISASGDWTLRLWQEGHENALLLFQSSNQEVNDVQWCPTNATVFGDVTSGGRLELWDFELSTVKPVITHKAGTSLSCLLFSRNSPVVVCGGDNGVISVFRTYNIEREYDTTDEQMSRLDETIRANVMKQQPGQMAGN